jgi:hypothetical protein
MKQCKKCDGGVVKYYNTYFYREHPDFMPIDGKPFERILTVVGHCYNCGHMFDALDGVIDG